MKRALTLCFCLSLLLAASLFAEAAQALEMKITDQISGRYALLVFNGAQPGQPLDKNAIIAQAQRHFDKSGVRQLQYVVYDQGKKTGDGARAFGEIRKDGQEALPFTEPVGRFAQALGKGIETALMGCEINPEDLHAAYAADAAAAAKEFQGKKLLLYLTVPQLEKDASGNPCIQFDLDEDGLSGLQIALDPRDPFLSRIKEDADIGIKVQARGFSEGWVMLDGVTVKDDEAILVDGKAVPLEELK